MSKKEKNENLESSSKTQQINCGLIMPIAPMTGYPSNQFSDVKSIIVDAVSSIEGYNFIPRLVSDSNGEVDIIHKSIVNNIYDDPIVIVDISGRNGNVMLELGLRLAFDKPVVIIKDDKTEYMFDISMIEHINYPSDLRHNEIEEFQKILSEKVVKTYIKSKSDPDYSPFLKQFQNITVSKGVENHIISEPESLQMILDKITNLEQSQKFLSKATFEPFVQNTGGFSEIYSIGDEIKHKKWGVGTIVKVSGYDPDCELDIAFPRFGVKRLIAQYAPIEKV